MPWGALSFGLGVIGAIGSKRSADKSAKAQNEFNKRQFEYDTILTDNQNKKLDSDYAYASAHVFTYVYAIAYADAAACLLASFAKKHSTFLFPKTKLKSN